MPADKPGWGGARIARRPDAKRAGPRKRFATVRLPIDDARAVLDYLNERKIDPSHPAERGMAFLIAGLWAELDRVWQEDADHA